MWTTLYFRAKEFCNTDLAVLLTDQEVDSAAYIETLLKFSIENREGG